MLNVVSEDSSSGFAASCYDLKFTDDRMQNCVMIDNFFRARMPLICNRHDRVHVDLFDNLILELVQSCIKQDVFLCPVCFDATDLSGLLLGRHIYWLTRVVAPLPEGELLVQMIEKAEAYSSGRC